MAKLAHLTILIKKLDAVESADYYAYKGLVQGLLFKGFDLYIRPDPSYSILPLLRYLDIDQIDGFAYSFVPTDRPTNDRGIPSIVCPFHTPPNTDKHPDKHHSWQFCHPKVWLTVPIITSRVVKYTQFHVDHATSEGLKAAGLPIGEFDGGVEIWARSIEELMVVFQDEEYLRVVVLHEEKFLKRHEAVMMIGRGEELWVDGKVVEGLARERAEPVYAEVERA
jgi:hypothetical protein